MRMAELPIAVMMERRPITHQWADEIWAAAAVMPSADRAVTVTPLQQNSESFCYLVSGLLLELYPDENNGYFENWAAPEPKVFVLWRMQDGLAMPILASVSYAEGTRMLDSGEAADGVPMPPEIHAWLGDYLQAHYQPPQRRGRHLALGNGDLLTSPCVPPDPAPSAWG
jgi:hypothetical protein